MTTNEILPTKAARNFFHLSQQSINYLAGFESQTEEIERLIKSAIESEKKEVPLIEPGDLIL